MAFGLAGDDDDVELKEFLDEGGVSPGNLIPRRILENFRAQDGVIFRERVVSLDLEIGLAVSGNGMEKTASSRDETRA